MRTTVIPAQITTIEDTIAGNLSLTQIVILLIPVFLGTLVFALLPPTMHIVLYKLPLVSITILICLVLSIRIKGKILVYWLHTLISYNMRPAYYVYNKNEPYLRDTEEVREVNKQVAKKVTKKEVSMPAKDFNMRDLQKLQKLIKNPRYSVQLRPDETGKLLVIASEIEGQN